MARRKRKWWETGAGAIYTGVDWLALGSLPDRPLASPIDYGDSLIGGLTGALPKLATDVGDVPPALTHGLPEAGENVGGGVGNTLRISLQGVGAGLWGGESQGVLQLKKLLPTLLIVGIVGTVGIGAYAVARRK